MHDFVYNQLKARTNDLELACRRALNPAYDPSSESTDDDLKLRVAFVGQYNAGKSSLVKMLTGIDDIAIGSNVTTDKSKEYDYKGLHIVDTPGIRASYSVAHDEEAFRAIAKADLLVFVITNELFDDVLASEFKKLCFEHRREKEMLLVVNKSQSDAGSKQTKLDAIAPVLEPLIPESFPIVFTDVASYFEAMDEDDATERAELLELSNRDGLVAAIDDFAADCGLYARLTTPLQGIQQDLQTALEKMQQTSPIEDGAISLMKQVKRVLQDSRRNFERSSLAIVDGAHSKIVREGAALASLVGRSSDEFDRTQASASAVCNRAGDEAFAAIDDQLRSDFKDLEDSLSALAKAPMAKQVMESLGVVDPVSGVSPNGCAPTVRNPGDEKPFNLKLGKGVTEHAQKGLSLLAKSAVGKSAKEGLSGVSGSVLHNSVKKVGELIGYKFKAWEAVKIADKLGKGAKFLGPVMAAAGVGMQVYSDYQESNNEVKQTAARREIRKEFGEYAEETKTHLLSALRALLETGYDTHILAVEKELNAILQMDMGLSREKQILVDHMNQVTDLLQEVQGKSPWGSARGASSVAS